MNKLEMLKTELQGLVDKGKITAKEYQDKIDSAIYSDGGYGDKGGRNAIHFVIGVGGLIIGYLIGKSYK